MAVYQYDSLDLERPTFRQVLLRRKVLDHIECDLIEASFDKDDIIPYDALSYTWGNEKPNCIIFLNDIPTMVTPNLHDALDHLRSASEDRILWVDAICINQSDTLEKNHQVGQMGEIYRRADQVIVWLGNSTGPTNALMPLLAQLDHSDTLRRVYGTSGDAPSDQMSSLLASCITEAGYSSEQNASAFHELLKRPWFYRVWVIQEVANARRISVQWGHNRVSGRAFRSAAELLQLQLPEHTKSVFDLMGGSRDRPKWWTQKRDLRTILVAFRGAKAGDERDKVFALLGLCQDFDQETLKADYSLTRLGLIRKTLSAVYRVPESSVMKGNRYIREVVDPTIETFLEGLAYADFHSRLQWGDAAAVESWLLENENTRIMIPWVWEVVASNAVNPREVMATLFQHRQKYMLDPEVLQRLFGRSRRDAADPPEDISKSIPDEMRCKMLQAYVDGLFSCGGKYDGGLSRLSELLDLAYYDQNESMRAAMTENWENVRAAFIYFISDPSRWSRRDLSLLSRLMKMAPGWLRDEVIIKLTKVLCFRPTAGEWSNLLSRYPPQREKVDEMSYPWELLGKSIVFVIRHEMSHVNGAPMLFNRDEVRFETATQQNLSKLQWIWGLPRELRLEFDGRLYSKAI